MSEPNSRQSGRSAIPCGWERTGNFGDELTPFLVSRLSQQAVSHVPYSSRAPKFLVVGSILHRANASASVWGSGLIAEDRVPAVPPHCIAAVRGPLTREQLERHGIACPAVYGDPALLLPLVYAPPRRVKYRLGVIPHYRDTAHPWVAQWTGHDDVLVLRMRRPRHDVRQAIDEIRSCEAVVSSSLHGLIVADAYGIPNLWLQLGDRVLGRGFKFRDHFAAVGRTTVEPCEVVDATAVELTARLSSYEPIRFDPRPMLQQCPFELSAEFRATA